MPLSRTRGIVGVVSDRRRLLPGASPGAQAHALVAQAVAAAEAGVDFFQVRERDLEARELSRLTAEVVSAVAGTPMLVLVNDRADVALASGAHGVHLPGNGLPPAGVRIIAPAGFFLGQSIHGIERADERVDVAIFGAIFPSLSKPGDHVPAGLEGLRAAARVNSVPVLAIGGITETNVGVVAPFCHGVAAIGWFASTDARRLFESVRHVRQVFEIVTPAI